MNFITKHFKTLLGIIILVLFLIFFMPRKCCDDSVIAPDIVNIDSIKTISDSIIAYQKDLITEAQHKIDSLEKKKSKIVYKTKYEVVYKSHDTCIMYFDSCVKDLEVCEEINDEKDTIIEGYVSINERLRKTNGLFETNLRACNSKYVELDSKYNSSLDKIKVRNKVILYESIGLVLLGTIIYLK